MGPVADIIVEHRRRILARLDASRPYLDEASLQEVAVEPVVQGLAILPLSESAKVVITALDQLERAHAEP